MSNMREDPVMCRLDRFFVSTEWVDLFPNCNQRALPQRISDHCPISIGTRMEVWDNVA